MQELKELNFFRVVSITLKEKQQITRSRLLELGERLTLEESIHHCVCRLGNLLLKKQHYSYEKIQFLSTDGCEKLDCEKVNCFFFSPSLFDAPESIGVKISTRKSSRAEL